MAEPQKKEPNEEQQHQLSPPAAAAATPESPAPAERSRDQEERTGTDLEAHLQLSAEGPSNFLSHFKRRKFFVLRVNISVVVYSKSVFTSFRKCIYMPHTHVVSESQNIYFNQFIRRVCVFATVHTYPIPYYRSLHVVGQQKIFILEIFSCHVFLKSFLTEATESPGRDIMAAVLRPEFRREKRLELHSDSQEELS